MQPDRLIRMANQIGRFFAVQGATHGSEDQAVADIAEHLMKFWAPRMRDAILALSAEQHALLEPLPSRAVTLLGERAPPRPDSVRTPSPPGSSP